MISFRTPQQRDGDAEALAHASGSSHRPPLFRACQRFGLPEERFDARLALGPVGQPLEDSEVVRAGAWAFTFG